MKFILSVKSSRVPAFDRRQAVEGLEANGCGGRFGVVGMFWVCGMAMGCAVAQPAWPGSAAR